MWAFWIDRGGTFTDCLGRDPVSGEVRAVKVLSSDRAPLIGIRMLLGIGEDEAIPPCEVRMGTTLATNALLERRGAACALVITRGFADLQAIGDQTRPELFALDIVKPEVLYREVIEVDARVAADGGVIARPDAGELEAELAALRARGVDSVAVVVLGAFLAPALEEEIGAVARAAGFAHVSLSTEVAREIGLLGRADTTVVDAYLTPLLRDYVDGLLAELPGSTLRIMQSSGGLAEARRFRGRDAVLSGPAGGVVAVGRVAERLGGKAIGFDMGGTSTDVSAWDGQAEREYETMVAGVRLRTPMMAIHTVAAGGGSVCRYDGFRFTVGPDSAGAVPGPLCYGAEGATELTLTDVDLVLGRVAGDRFPFGLDVGRAEAAVDAVAARAGMERAEVAAGFCAVADSAMAEAIRRVSIGKGRDVRSYALVVFGGAGGQHACAIARQLGVRTLVFDRWAGVLSAYGMGLAEVSWHGETDALGMSVEDDFSGKVAELVARAEVRGEVRAMVDLRYVGADAAIAVRVPATREAFEQEHRRLFGYVQEGREVEAVVVRVEVSMRERETEVVEEVGEPVVSGPERMQAMWSGGRFEQVPVWWRERMPGIVKGPALILDATNTVVVDVGFVATVEGEALVVRDEAPLVGVAPEDAAELDPIRLEIFNNLYMSIATQMGEALRRTAVSTNIRERLDFSCAVFDAEGGLVANAPHIPVHLGAMGESIRAVLAKHPRPEVGDVYVTNDPAGGGSHLPDVTVVTPVHEGGEVLFFTASRGHHADVGGVTPGSMPPFSTTLEEEGVVFRCVPVVRGGRFDEAAARAVLEGGPWPARRPADNLADLQAQIAANRTGAALLEELARRWGRATVLAYMGHVQDNAAAEVTRRIEAIADGEHRFVDAMDDGTPVAVSIRVRGGTMEIDFGGTGAESEGNLNAPRAVAVSAVIYVLRCLVGAPIPLNAGCLRPVTIRIPEGCLLSPGAGRAVCGGNVETSQRVVDVLLGALGVAAASQGTMNNLTLGGADWGYYETIAGGAGATATAAGASGVHTHMTNTRITDPEVMEARFPVRVIEMALRRGSGGAGRHRGGDGLVRELELLAPMQVSLLSERRDRAPFGLAGGEPGAPGRMFVDGAPQGGKASFAAPAGARLRIETPGGGGFGRR